LTETARIYRKKGWEKMDDGYLFKMTDCMGNIVVLKKLTFENKIHKDHPEVPIQVIKDIVEHTHLINIDDLPNRYDYYKIIINPTPNSNDFIFAKAVLEKTDLGYCEVVTSYLKRKLTDEVNRGVIYDAGAKNRSEL
jgi:hypothetical protein